MELRPYARAILHNIESRGLLRYDPSDIDIYLAEKRAKSRNDRLRKGYRLLDIIMPIGIRKALSVSKEMFITAPYHLGMALLPHQTNQANINTSLSPQYLAELAIREFYDPSTHLWRFSHPNFIDESEKCIETQKMISMPMHGLARINIFLLALWRAQGEKTFLDIAVNSMEAVIHQHNIREYGDGTASISYYYNSDENVLNVNSEFLQWLADIPTEYRPNEAVALGHKILKMLVQEQNEDGSFYYFSKENMEVRHIGKTIDNHHTSYVLCNLVHILNSDFPTQEERQWLLQACQRGMEFSLSHLFDTTTGAAKYMIGNPRRQADAVTYSEAIVAMCAFLHSPCISNELKDQLRSVLPKVMKHLLDMISLRDGSAPSQIVFGISTKLDSIRWGNGPALQAIFDYYDTTGKGF